MVAQWAQSSMLFWIRETSHGRIWMFARYGIELNMEDKQRFYFCTKNEQF
jgi:hypothetical protein